MGDSWEFRNSIKRDVLKRIVADGNFLQSLVSKLDLQLSTDQETDALETLSFIGTTLSQMDADSTSLANALHFEE